MNKATALASAIDGQLVTCGSLPEGKCLKFEGGSFKVCDADGSGAEAITTLPTDAEGWEVVELPEAPVELAFHVNSNSGNAFISKVGTAKFLQREANPELTRVTAPVGVVAA